MLVLVDIPDTALPAALNGAVAELYTNAQGQPAADIRIPAPSDLVEQYDDPLLSSPADWG